MPPGPRRTGPPPGHPQQAGRGAEGGGPPCGVPPHASHHHRSGGHRPWGLRRRLTFAFAFVALAAVGLTVWLTLGAVFEAQRELFEPAAAGESATGRAETDEPAGQEDGQIGEEGFGPPWWLGRAPWWDRMPGGDGGPPWDEPGFGTARSAFHGVSRTAFLAAIISFLLAVAAASMVTRFLTRPLAALTEGAERFGAGERGFRLALPSSRDELRRLTEAFNDLVAGLERQETWRREMVADVAHDLRTPLAVMRSEIEAMQDGVTPVDGGALDRLHSEVMMIARLVGDLRALSLAESGALTLEREETPLRPFLDGVAESFAHRAAEMGATMTVTEAPTGLTASFDRQRVRQLLGNLIDNALRHGEHEPVELAAAASDAGVRIWVRDHGTGLSEEALQRVFERFYRVDPARFRGDVAAGQSAGSGLGLAIAKALAEAHGGRIEASNHPHGGALFTVFLPQPSEGSKP
jgi:two-component system sensor histidine kinase BaeS